MSKAWLCLVRADADPSSCEDPARRQLYDTEAEKNFHEASKYNLPFAGSVMNYARRLSGNSSFRRRRIPVSPWLEKSCVFQVLGFAQEGIIKMVAVDIANMVNGLRNLIVSAIVAQQKPK